MKQALINFYLEWFNSYLTVSVMAEQHQLDKDDCQTLLYIGEKLHDAECERLKEKSAASKLSSNPYKGMGLDDIYGHMAKQVTDILNK